MIFVDKNTVQESNFLSLLSHTKTNCLAELQDLGTEAIKLNGDKFETLVFNNSVKASINTEFEGHVEQTRRHAFPDIIAKRYFGVEVKVTKDNKWSSTGNSILEGTRAPGVERIYMFFGKLGGGADIKYRPYQHCLSDIGVTHSPRYKIDMDLPDGKSIFDKMSVSYDDLRNEKNPIFKFKDYYKKKLQDGQELWWIDAQVEERTVSPIIKPFRMLHENEQGRIITESMILFPEIFSRTQKKYERPAAYLITQYNTFSANLRDEFTAGGQENINVNGVEVHDVPKIFFHLMEKAKDIETVLEKLSEERLKYYWRTEHIKSPRVEQWKRMVDNHTGTQLDKVSASDIYEWGLRNK